MREQIKKMMDEYGYKPSSFADKVQVSRSTISQILGKNGRQNDPSKSTIDKILKAFPDISPSWFLTGEGEMHIRVLPFINPVSSSGQLDLFGENKAVDSSEKPKEREYPSKIEDKKPEKETNSAVFQGINLSNNISKKIEKIIIFFNDKTFMTFISED